VKQPATYRVLRFWQKVDLNLGFNATYDIIPERKIRSDDMSDILFEAIVAVVKKQGCSYELYTVDKKMIERT
jgi:hypothetical protein